MIGKYSGAALIFLVAALTGLVPEARAADRTWRTLGQLSAQELKVIDIRPVKARTPEQSYLPEEPYPFSAPYTAEEVGYRLMNFTHMARWSHVMADIFGSVTKTGYLSQSAMSGMVSHKGAAGPVEQIDGEPGDVYSDQIYYYTYPPKDDGVQQMWNLRRTGPDQATKLDYFAYSPSLRRVRRQPPPRRETQFPDSVQSFDDVVGREAWEFSWRFIGADILYETVRFPNTRPIMTLARADGSFYDKDPTKFKMLGDDYPKYRADGGVDCFVIVSEPQRDWLPDYGISKLIYWIDQHFFYPLRIEQYDSDGNLKTIQVRLAQQEKADLPGGEGYTNSQAVYLDISLDLTAFSVHDSHKAVEWTEEEKALFTPDFMRRRWLTHPRKSFALIDSPDQFYLRPHIFAERFPTERSIQLPADLAARIKAQNAAGRLVFTDEE
jgi:hypothetical protein